MRRRHAWALPALLILTTAAILAGVWATIPGAAAVPAAPRAPVDASVTTTASLNWAGYADTAPTSSVTSISGTWVEPTVSCPARGSYYAVFWVGIDGFNSNTVEQTGTLAHCSSGKASYSAWWELYPLNNIQPISGVIVHPRDSMSASVIFSSSGFTMAITDSTTGKSFSTTATQSGTQRNSAECIVERPATAHSLTKLADFGSMTFGSCQATISGSSAGIGATNAAAFEITMVDSRGKILAVPDSASNSGSTFSVTWKASS